MGTEDYTMSDGDNVLGDDGNYVTTETASGKMYRLLMAKRGYWPAASHDSALEFGRNYRDRAKWAETDVAEWIADAEDAFQPLVDSGDITDLKIVEVPSTVRSSPRFRITAIDTRTHDKISLGPVAPWGP